MTPLAEHLVRRISLEGPIPLAEYMAAALAHPQYGYYTTRNPLGRAGDFITGPEVSQMFGELVGLWCAVVWQAMGSPDPFRLVELGPGRGTLMADALRAARAVPAFGAAAEVHLVEISPVFRAFQKRALQDLARPPLWHDDFGAVPAGPMLLVANEFFDALPIRQYRRTEDGWHEAMVDVSNGALCLALAPQPVATALIPEALQQAEPGAVVEVSPMGQGLARAIGGRLAADGGAALVIDYGHMESGCGDTFQAVREHAYADVLAEPGHADLTAHVDFQALAAAAAAGGAAVSGPTTQERFLESLGIRPRGEALLAGAREDQQEEIQSAYRRLVHPDEMGTLFKVLGLAQPGLGYLPGFE